MIHNRNKHKLAIFLLCIPFLGGWTSAPAQTEEVRYDGGVPLATYASETISYISKEVEDISTAYPAPAYYQIEGLQNSCGPVAGAITVGFYDKYYDDLIPGWSSVYSTGRYRLQDSVYVPALMNDLYTRMNTNSTGVGVTENEFKTGLNSYVVSKGHNLSYVSLGAGNNFNYSTFKSAVSNNKVAVLFVKPSNLYQCSITTNNDEWFTVNIGGNHIMIAYGYYEIKYTLTNGTRTEKFLRVSTGWDGLDRAFYKVGSYIDSAYLVEIN